MIATVYNRDQHTLTVALFYKLQLKVDVATSVFQLSPVSGWCMGRAWNEAINVLTKSNLTW